MDVTWFARAVASDRIRWVLFNGRPRLRHDKRVGATKVLMAVRADCPRIPQAAYAGRRRFPHGALYDCSGRAAALMRDSRSLERLAAT
jgi:hypothetical protein